MGGAAAYARQPTHESSVAIRVGGLGPVDPAPAPPSAAPAVAQGAIEVIELIGGDKLASCLGCRSLRFGGVALPGGHGLQHVAGSGGYRVRINRHLGRRELRVGVGDSGWNRRLTVVLHRSVGIERLVFLRSLGVLGRSPGCHLCRFAIRRHTFPVPGFLDKLVQRDRRPRGIFGCRHRGAAVGVLSRVQRA